MTSISGGYEYIALVSSLRTFELCVKIQRPCKNTIFVSSMFFWMISVSFCWPSTALGRYNLCHHTGPYSWTHECRLWCQKPREFIGHELNFWSINRSRLLVSRVLCTPLVCFLIFVQPLFKVWSLLNHFVEDKSYLKRRSSKQAWTCLVYTDSCETYNIQRKQIQSRPGPIPEPWSLEAATKPKIYNYIP